jgi:hypothetical protein
MYNCNIKDEHKCMLLTHSGGKCGGELVVGHAADVLEDVIGLRISNRSKDTYMYSILVVYTYV